MGTTLREQLSEAFSEHVEPETQVTPAEPVETPLAEAVQAPPEAQETPKPGRTAGRQRDEHGRLLPGKAQRDSATESGKPSLPPPSGAQDAKVPPVAEPRPPRPSSWKKDFWEHWDKLDPALATYLHQRESEAIKGVSTYKAEYDRLKPLGAAMQEFEPLLKQHGIQGDQWIRNLGNAHKVLAMGGEQEKLSMFLKLANDYRVPLQALFVQGQDGRTYFNPQVQAYQPPQQPAQQHDVRAEVQQVLAQERINNTIAQFEAEAPQKYPHYEVLKPTMVGLLQAELAEDLPDAYQQALKHPRHADLYADIQKQEAAEKAKRDADEKAKGAARARNQAVSVRGSSPAASPDAKPKGVRAALEEAFDAHVGGGRV